MAGAIPFRPFKGGVLVVVVVFTDIVTSGGLGGRLGMLVTVGPNEMDTVLRERVELGTAGEFGL
jgi:hypothetical protein